MAAFRRALDRLASLLRQGGAVRRQQGAAARGASLAGAAQQVNVGWASREQVVDVAFTVADHGDRRRLIEAIAGDLGAMQPTAGLLLVRLPGLWVPHPPCRAVDYTTVHQTHQPPPL